MSFLQPWMLIALPMVAIPIIIHLVNQRRFQTVPWAAMRFLLEANRMSSGYTKLRQWLILAMRTLAILALILFTARPLTSGIMALLSGESGSQAIVVLDRSSSMGDLIPGTNTTRLESAIDQLAKTFETLGIQRIVQIDEVAKKPEEFSSLSQWLRAVPRTTWSASSDIPGQLEQALAYAKNNPAGNTVVWLCSDLRESDWRSRDGRWAALRDGFQSLPNQVRFSILDLSNDRVQERAIRVTGIQCLESSGKRELSLSFRVDTVPGTDTSVEASAKATLPVEIAVGNSRSSMELDWTGGGAQVNDYRIPLATLDEAGNTSRRGWGWVRIPGDSNPTNDTSYFVFEQPPPRRTLIVSESPELVSAIELCASIAPQQMIQCETELVSASQFLSMALADVALVVWHERLPTGKSLELLQEFMKSGGQLLLVPPEVPDDTQAFGIQWGEWEMVKSNLDVRSPSVDDADSSSMARIAQWQNDSQLLSNTLNGAPLPLGQLGIRRICSVIGALEPLATLPDGQPILAAIESKQDEASPSSLYVSTTTPSDRDSTMAGDGVVLYVAVQRLLAQGSLRVATVKQAVAGVDRGLMSEMPELRAGEETAPSTEYGMHAGVYDDSGTWIALERGKSEEAPQQIDDSVLGTLFGDLSWAKVGVGRATSRLVQEIWRWFAIAMVTALLLEAILCLPRIKRASPMPQSLRS